MTRRLPQLSGADAVRHPLQVRLLGKFSVQYGDRVLDRLSAAKAQELLGYLLLHRARPHAREAVAAMLWGDVPTPVSRKYLRQALWQLHASVRAGAGSRAGAILVMDSDWLRVNSAASLWLDVADFEDAFSATRGVRCENMDDETYGVLRAAVDLYRGDLLDGWYREWCLSERERLQAMYLALLDTLMGYCAVHGRFDEGLSYGALSLRQDVARERTHQHLMRLHALAGDRTAALRQFRRCISALQEELGVEASEATLSLCRQISTGQLGGALPRASTLEVSNQVAAPALSDVLGRLKQFQVTLAEMQRRVHQDIQVVERILGGPAGPESSEAQPPVRLVAALRGESPAEASSARMSMKPPWAGPSPGEVCGKVPIEAADPTIRKSLPIMDGRS